VIAAPYLLAFYVQRASAVVQSNGSAAPVRTFSAYPFAYLLYNIKWSSSAN
jgi:hypothetical protein